MSRTRAQGQVPVARFALSRLLLIASCLSHISVCRISDGGVTSYFWPHPKIYQACLLTGRFDQSPAGQAETLRIIIDRYLRLEPIGCIVYVSPRPSGISENFRELLCAEFLDGNYRGNFWNSGENNGEFIEVLLFEIFMVDGDIF